MERGKEICELRVASSLIASCELGVNIDSNNNNTHKSHFHSQGTKPLIWDGGVCWGCVILLMQSKKRR